MSPGNGPFQRPGAAASAAARSVGAKLTWADRWDHLLARSGVRRFGHRVEPGLYALGSPAADSPVFVTAGYTLSFDALRSSLAGRRGFILVLDTGGINVWCAAGGGKFSTDELAGRIRKTGLPGVVNHRRLILPQLSASGISAHEVGRRTGFTVVYGPVRANDLPAFLDSKEATPAMRRVTFTLGERAVVIPVELVQVLPWALPAGIVLWLLGGGVAAAALAAAILAGAVAFPLLLPYIPTRDFSSKGFVLGLLAAAPFAAGAVSHGGVLSRLTGAALAASALLVMPAVTAYLALNFTGSTPFTSKSQVRREMLRYIPVMAWMLGAGLVLGIGALAARVLAGG